MSDVSDSRLQPCALNNGEGKIYVWVFISYIVGKVTCILEASTLFTLFVCSLLTFQSIPASVSPHHYIKLKVSHGVISRSNCCPPPNP